jgi:hypothetical protein
MALGDAEHDFRQFVIARFRKAKLRQRIVPVCVETGRDKHKLRAKSVRGWH